ncbi:hypothetical protein Bca52824_076502 [Brassica carinata]|uniref:Uncharacterized protein n=1 Tax=Brassica carinata TaxID=52824 RepID=A0A8X7PV93_BRACI|nr:hypothetical protein Bca52824_076502 [Brassica carinata]
MTVLFCSCTILRHDVLGQETLLNLFLRNYLPYNLYDKAERLRSKAPRFEAHSNQQAVRIGDLELSNVQERFETFSVNMTHNLINAFNSRIAFCLNMHNEAVRALRFPPNTHMEKESEETSRERDETARSGAHLING